MYLKISDGNGEWTLFDNVDRVNFGIQRESIQERSDLDRFEQVEVDLINLISKDCFPRKEPLNVGVIEFYRNGSKVMALFASIVYILNEAGDTVEKISANNQRKMKNV